jgi:hypothetical protein
MIAPPVESGARWARRGGTELIFLGHELNVQDSNVLTQQRGGFLEFLAHKRQLLSGRVLEDVQAKHEAKEIGESRSSIGIESDLTGGVDVAGNRGAAGQIWAWRRAAPM